MSDKGSATLVCIHEREQSEPCGSDPMNFSSLVRCEVDSDPPEHEHKLGSCVNYLNGVLPLRGSKSDGVLCFFFFLLFDYE